MILMLPTYRLSDGPTKPYRAIWLCSILNVRCIHAPLIARFLSDLSYADRYPSILLCRFILNLRAAVDQPRNNSSMTSPKSFSLFNTDLLVGNLGEPLEIGEEIDEQHVGEEQNLSETLCDSDQATTESV